MQNGQEDVFEIRLYDGVTLESLNAWRAQTHRGLIFFTGVPDTLNEGCRLDMYSTMSSPHHSGWTVLRCLASDGLIYCYGIPMAIYEEIVDRAMNDPTIHALVTAFSGVFEEDSAEEGGYNA